MKDAPPVKPTAIPVTLALLAGFDPDRVLRLPDRVAE
jgi:hypothetical protein